MRLRREALAHRGRSLVAAAHEHRLVHAAGGADHAARELRRVAHRKNITSLTIALLAGLLLASSPLWLAPLIVQLVR